MAAGNILFVLFGFFLGGGGEGVCSLGGEEGVGGVEGG